MNSWIVKKSPYHSSLASTSGALQQARQASESDSVGVEVRPLLQASRHRQKIVPSLQRRYRGQSSTGFATYKTHLFSAEINAIAEKRSINKISPIAGLNSFEDKDWVLRVGGRLMQMESFEYVKHPIMLKSDHHFSRLLVIWAHCAIVWIPRLSYESVSGCAKHEAWWRKWCENVTCANDIPLPQDMLP